MQCVCGMGSLQLNGKIPHFCLNTLEELIGWVMPNKFTPRNNRTNRTLYFLDYNAKVDTSQE